MNMFGFSSVFGFIPNQPTLPPQKEKFHLSLYYHVFRGFDCEFQEVLGFH